MAGRRYNGRRTRQSDSLLLDLAIRLAVVGIVALCYGVYRVFKDLTRLYTR